MELLRSWCNDELRLSQPVRNFEGDFRNGVLLGEILHKHGLLDDAPSLARGDGAHAMITNFNKLQPALRKLNIELDSRLANQIMLEKPGVATNMVYQLKLALENASKQLGTSLPVRRDRADLSLTTLSASRPLRAPHEEMRQRTFDQQLRMQASNPRELRMSHHLAKFTATMYEQTARATDAQARDDAELRAMQGTRTFEQRERLRESRAFLDEWTANSAARHSLTMKVHRQSQKEDLKWELTARERRARAERSATARHVDELEGGLHEFEQTLRQIGGAGGGADDDDDAAVEEDAAAIVAASRAAAERPTQRAHLDHLAAQLPAAEAMAADVEGYLARLRARKAEEAVARKERELRRRRILLEQTRAQAELDACAREAALLDKLGRQSAEEQRMAEALWRTRQEAEVMRDNRRLREDDYEARRALDMAERAQRNQARAAARLVEYKATLARERARFEDAEAARVAVAHERREAECRRLAYELVALTLRAETYTADARESLIPAAAWREMVTLFVAGVPLDALSGAGTTRAEPPADTDGAGAAGRAGALAAAADTPLAPPAATDARPRALLAETDVSHYLAGSAEWAAEALAEVARGLPAVGPPPPPAAGEKHAPQQTLSLHFNFALAELSAAPAEAGAAIGGQVLYALIEASAPPPPPPPPPALPASKLRLALVGRPFAGKSTTALALAGAANLELLLPTELVHAAIAEFEAAADGGGGHEADGAAASLGGRARDALAAGKPVPDDVLAALVARAAASVDDARAGFLIDDFPTTPEQLVLLEKGLTGYEPVVDLKKKPPQSRLVPPPAGATEPPPPRAPGLDAVIRLEISDDLARRRALGRRVDPQTGRVYHLELAPAADDDDLQQRLVPLGTDAHSEAQLLPLLLAYSGCEPALESWTAALKLGRRVDASVEPAAVLAAVGALVDELVAAKAQARLDADAAAAAAGESAADAAAAAAAAAAAEAAATAAAAGKAVLFPPLPLEPAVAAPLLAQWRALERGYLGAIKNGLRQVHDARWATLQHATSQAAAFAARLAQPDERQEAVALAQAAFNALEPELRAHDDGKAELHARVDDLQDRLWALVDAKREACEHEVLAMALGGFAQHTALHVLNALLALAQAEADRCVATVQLVGAFTAARSGQWRPPAQLGGLPRVELELASAVGVVLKLPQYDGFDTAAAQTTDGKDPKKKAAAPAKKPAAASAADGKGNGKGGAVADARELPVPMTGESALEQLLYRTRAVLALADALDAAAAAADGDAAAAAAADAADATLAEPKRAANAAARALGADERALWRAEAAKLRRRLRALVVHGAAALLANARALERGYDRLDEMMGERVRAELAAVGGLVRLMRAAVESETTLDHLLELDDGAALVVDQNRLVVKPTAERPPAPPRRRADELRLSAAQVGALAARFQAETRAPTLPLRDALDVLRRAAAAAELPPLWRQFGRDTLRAVCARFSLAGAATQQVSWAALVYALAQVPGAEAASLAHTAEALEALALSAKAAAVDAGAPPHEGLARADWERATLWFGHKARGSGGGGSAHEEADAEAFERELELKCVLFDALAAPAQPPSRERALDPHRFMLYACDSTAKAFAVSAHAHHGAVTAAQLHALLHRDELPRARSPAARTSAAADPFSMEVVRRLFRALGCDPETDRVPYLMVAAHPLGTRLLERCPFYERAADGGRSVYAALEDKLREAGDALDM
jgi:hypothetical protein